MKRKSELTRILLPEDIAKAGFSAADSRTKPFIDQWARMQSYEGGMTVHELVRQVYLQGVWDGVQVSDRLKDIMDEPQTVMITVSEEKEGPERRE